MLKKGFTLPLILIGFVTLAILTTGYYVKNSSKQISSPSSLQKENQLLKKQVEDKETEINYLIQDGAQVFNSYQTPYKFTEFGVYSPLLENKEVYVTEFKYKRSIIRNKSVKLDEEPGTSISSFISIWEFERQKTPQDYVTQYVIFDGYENYGSHPVSIQKYVDGDCKGEIYQGSTKYFFKFCYDYIWNPKDLNQTIYLNSFQRYSPTNNEMLIRIGSVYSGKESDVSKVKKKLFEIADTLSQEVISH